MNPLLTPELGTYVWSLVIFLTVLFVLKKYAWNPLLDFLEEREKDIAESLEMAESAKTNLEKIKDESEKILNKAKKEGKTIVSDSKLRAEESANKILDDAKAKSNEFLDDAKSKIEIEKKRAIKEIKEEVVDLSLELATKVLQRNVKDDDNNKFIKSSLEAVKADEAKS
ncbi:MAG: ATP synthase F0 subunit B [SAR202 cluster bacterium]|jgi:F-type H+-transporting ATPase subunit b|nr:MAG: ATP synthase F0 subunit B [SAR202 cluster bacterium]|tara:strand:- start:343 stop:849 length:507 start_codon:yes stop_codon:yes gene_type:complete